MTKAWHLLQTTLPDTDIARRIAFKTDLHDSPPSGIHWTPIVRGFLFNDYYLILRTYPDTSSDVRRGRVYSHCLIIEKKHLEYIRNLDKLFLVFPIVLTKELTLTPLTIEVEGQEEVEVPANFRQRFNKVIKSLPELDDHENTIVWMGQECYELAVCEFWKILSPDQKVNFNFGINFEPQEIPKGKINLITVPITLETKFSAKGYVLVKHNESVVLENIIDLFLAGDKEVKERLAKFSVALEVDLKTLTLNEKSVLAKGLGSFENIKTNTDFKSISTFSNIIAKFANNEEAGSELKEDLIDRICELLPELGVDDVTLLKHFQVNSFQQSQERLGLATKDWVRGRILSLKDDYDLKELALIRNTLSLEKDNWWSKVILEEILKFLTTLQDESAVIVLQWINKDSSLLSFIEQHISGSASAENHFIEAFRSAANHLELWLGLAIRKKWLSLYASILKKLYTFSTAVEKYLEQDTHKLKPIILLVEGVKPKEVMNVFLKHNDKRFLTVLGPHLKKDQSLLGGMDLRQPTWQSLLLCSVQGGNEIDAGLSNSRAVFYAYYDFVVDGNKPNDEILVLLSESAYCDVLEYPRRNEFWKRISQPFRQRFLEKTSAHLLESLSKNSTYEVPADQELSDYIVQYAITDFLYYNRENLKGVLPIFTTYEKIGEQTIRDYVSNYRSKIDAIDATNLGRLIVSRNMSSVATAVFHKYHDFVSFKPALLECVELLGFWSKAKLQFSSFSYDFQISEDDWWDAFVELTIKLYPNGPKENKIWKHSDGEESDLLVNGTGKEIWTAALRKLRLGGCTGITLKKLLKTMGKDFAKNNELRTLRDLRSKI